MRRALAVGAAVIMLSACAGTQPVRPVDPAGTDDPTVVSTTGAGLQERRRAAGIEDCPATGPHGGAVAGGLPELTLDCLGGGEPVALAALRGPLVINVWAQWCAPCRAEAPFLAEAAQQRPEVDFLGVDYQDPDPAGAIDFAGAAGWDWPQLADPERELAGPLGIVGPPMTFLVDENGSIVARHVGQLTSTDQLVALIDTHLR